MLRAFLQLWRDMAELRRDVEAMRSPTERPSEPAQPTQPLSPCPTTDDTPTAPELLTLK